jgi:hypothetical protein
LTPGVWRILHDKERNLVLGGVGGSKKKLPFPS